jgi:tetratricopeptide (TPR) repeat protein
MRLSISIHAPAIEMRLARALALRLLCLSVVSWSSPRTIAQDAPSPASVREQLHQSEQWANIAKHLPNPATASPKELEEQADILRARRFPEDAMDYYKYALARGGDQAKLTNKLGLCELELRNIQLARVYFQRVVKMNRKYSDAWNNLGAVEFLDGLSLNAVSDYKKAIKLDKREAVFHANLATAYFELKDYGDARRQMAQALGIDPQVFDQQGNGGVAAHILSSQDRARFSFEMARLYARGGQVDQMLHSLAMASEAGMDVQPEMRRDPAMARFEMDPRVLVLVHNAQVLRAGREAALRDAKAASAQPVSE